MAGTEIHRLLGTSATKLITTNAYLRGKEYCWRVQFIEDLYRLVLGLANLQEKSNVPERAINFVIKCQRPGGGFSRAIEMGIANLEYTYYALSVFSEVGAI